MKLKNLIEDLNKLKNPQKANFLAGYFKTGKGEKFDESKRRYYLNK